MLTVHLLIETTADYLPTEAEVQYWLDTALQFAPTQDHRKTAVNIAIIDKMAMTELNQNFRQKKGPTNVLSFPDEPIPGLDSDSLGDIAICAPLVKEEALDQEKWLKAHWAHLLVHGFLHLQGFDHIDETEATVMENLEVKILSTLGFKNPYEA